MNARKIPRIVRIMLAAVMMAGFLWVFFGDGRFADKILMFQLGPALAGAAGAFSVKTLLVIALILGLTFVFGRFYCSAVCPLGILQDFLGFLTGKVCPRQPNLYMLRYITAFVVFTLLLFGVMTGLRLLEPFSMFGAIISLTKASILPLIIITALAVWKKRIYCTSLCPVGTVLGLCAKKGVFRLRLSAGCTGCGSCEKVCPCGCINSDNKELDNERCVRCFNCKAVCPDNRITYGRSPLD